MNSDLILKKSYEAYLASCKECALDRMVSNLMRYEDELDNINYIEFCDRCELKMCPPGSYYVKDNDEVKSHIMKLVGISEESE